MIEIKKQNAHIWILLLIVAAAIFVRTYKFSDLILFRADQVRDANIAKQALDKGMGYLPLLGPKGGNSVYIEGDTESGGDDNVYLGPIYYYFQYFSALIFQSAFPSVFVLPDLLFSIASIPLLYYLLRHFFPSRTSLLATALFAFSFFLVQHARFSWNPNPMIFWQLLLLLGLFKTSTENDKKKAGKWLVSVFVSLAIITQLHFLALFAAPVVVALFWLIYPPKSIRLRYWMVAIGILVLLYLPVIAFEIRNDGENLKRLMVSAEQEKNGDTFLKTIGKTIEQHGSFYVFALTSLNKHAYSKIELVGTLLVFASIGCLSYLLLFKKLFGFHVRFEKKHKVALVLFLIYFLVFFALYFRISHVLGKQRYWLATGSLPFILYAIWIQAISNLKYNKISSFVPYLLTFLFVVFNITGIIFLFITLEKGYRISLPLMERPTMRPYIDLITFEQIAWSVGFMRDVSLRENKIPCYSVQGYQVKNAFKYTFNLLYPNLDVMHGIDFNENHSNCKYFLVTETEKATSILDEKFAKDFYSSNFTIHRSITVWELESKTDKNEPSSPYKEDPENEIIFEHTWNKIFAR